MLVCWKKIKFSHLPTLITIHLFPGTTSPMFIPLFELHPGEIPWNRIFFHSPNYCNTFLTKANIKFWSWNKSAPNWYSNWSKKVLSKLMLFWDIILPLLGNLQLCIHCKSHQPYLLKKETTERFHCAAHVTQAKGVTCLMMTNRGAHEKIFILFSCTLRLLLC